METRPKLNLELEITDKLIDMAGWVGLVFLWGLTITVYSKLPDIIPTHFDLSGQPNAHGSKMAISSAIMAMTTSSSMRVKARTPCASG
jgi:uncharacterized membrane protein